MTARRQLAAVLPDPGPARTSMGPDPWAMTASCWQSGGGCRSSMVGAMVMVRNVVMGVVAGYQEGISSSKGSFSQPTGWEGSGAAVAAWACAGRPLALSNCPGGPPPLEGCWMMTVP